MDYTTEHNVTRTAWLLIADGVKNCGIQFDSQGAIRVHVGTVEPVDLDAPGILISSNIEGVPSTFGLGALPEDAKVWVKTSGEFDETKLTVLAY